MKNLIVFIITSLMIGSLGFCWGVLDAQRTYNLPSSEINKWVKEQLNISTTPANKPVPSSGTDRGAEPTVPTEKTDVAEPAKKPTEPDTPSRFSAPKEKLTLPEPPKEKPKPPEPDPDTIRKQKVANLVSEGDKFYDEGYKHLQNTFKKDNTFDAENALALAQFNQAIDKYSDALDLDQNNKNIQIKLRDSRIHQVTCKRQIRRH